MGRRVRISVGRRLTLLVAVEALTALVLVAVGLATLARLGGAANFMYRFVLVPIERIELAQEEVALLATAGSAREQELAVLDRLAGFAQHYAQTIQAASSTGPDAERQRREMQRAGRLDLMDQEQRTVASIQNSIGVLSTEARGGGVVAADVDSLRRGLRELLLVNLNFVDLAQRDIVLSEHRARLVLVTTGIVGILLAGFLGLQVQRAIAPRIASLVRGVQRFRDFGVHERQLVAGEDEIAVLGNALDVGFAAISQRNRERSHFLAIAAHELKTPMVSILGFVDTAVNNPEKREHALEVIRRHTARLGRLVDELLWAASAGSGQLAFHPIPLNLAELVRRTAREVQDTLPHHNIELESPSALHVLADEGLVAHLLWSLLSYGAALSARDEPLNLSLEPTDTRVVATLQVHGPPLPIEALFRVFEPFSSIQYESDSVPRCATGLFLCREIARLHGGTLRVTDEAGVGPKLILDLPC
jgi:signal transduction histidine kinase